MSSWPEDTGSGESDFVIERSATGLTVVVALAELLAEFGSPVADETLAVLVIDPVDGGVTLIVMAGARAVRDGARASR